MTHAQRILQQLAEDDRDTLESRQAKIRAFVDAHDEATEDEEGGQYDDYRTEAQVELVLNACEKGLIPDLTSNGPHPVNFYGVKCHIEEWRRSLDKTQEELEERHQDLVTKKNPYASSTDGSSGQWATWRRYCLSALEWLMGTHDSQGGGA